MRLQQSLAGSWQFQLDPDGLMRVDQRTAERSIPVPLPWQAADPALEKYSGYAWYAREFVLGDAWLAGEVLLAFGAVDYWCEVFVNGQRVGEHEGGYTAFRFPIRQYLQAGTNTLALRVYDAVYSGMSLPRWYEGQSEAVQPFDPIHVPHGKQTWYLDASGIWQDVTLTAVPLTYIDEVRVTPDIHTGEALVRVMLGGDLAAAQGSLRASLGAAASTIDLSAGRTAYDLRVHVENPTLWTPETPALYTLEAALENGDAQVVRFGFREIAVSAGRLLLNDQPLYLLAALDQDMYPGTIYTVPSEAFLRDEFRKAKELGLNCLRCHIKPPDPLYLDLADEMGLLVWAEIPSWRTFYPRNTLAAERFNVTDDIKARVVQTLEQMIARDFNHPSIIAWSIANEDWGTATQLSADDRAWLAEMYDLAKTLDPTRLVVDNSACLTNVHVKSDLDDYHVYANIPDSARFFDAFIDSFGKRPGWTYSGHGDAQRSGSEALILSEFGNWGLPSVEALREKDGSLPDWFKLGPWWSGWEGEPGWPRGVLERFERFGLKAVWGDYEAFAQATQFHQHHAMKYEIEVMRRQQAIQGYVITELSDIYWESNGLLDFNRGKKAYHDTFALINAPDVVIPRLPRYATWDDQPLPMQLFVSHYSAADWSAASLEVTVNSRATTQPVPPLARGSVADLGVQELRFDPADKTGTRSVTLTVSSADSTLARNEAVVLVLPAADRQPAYMGRIAVAASHDSLLGDTRLPLANGLSSLGYHVNREFAEGDVIVSANPTEAELSFVRDGGKMLYLCTGISPFYWRQDRGGVYSGNWMTSFNWLRPGIFRRLGVSSPLTLPFRDAAPTGVFLSLPVEDAAVQGDFLAGQITGWVGHPAVHTVQFRFGKGIVLMTTYALDAAFRGDPVATAMLHDLIDHLASDACQPTLTANL